MREGCGYIMSSNKYMEFDNIRQTIEKIHESLRAEIFYSSVDTLCDDYNKAKLLQQSHRSLHKQLINQLVNQINDYIDYPTRSFLIFKWSQKASWRVYETFHGDFDGYLIKIPYVDKREYYCVVRLLETYKYIPRYINKYEFWFTTLKD